VSRRHQWLVFGVSMRFAVLLGAVFGVFAGAASFQPPLAGAAFGALSTAIYAFVLMGLLGGAEIFLPTTHFGRALGRAPFFAVVAVKSVVYSAVVVAVVVGKLGPHIALLAFDADLAAGFDAQLQSKLPRGYVAAVLALSGFFMVLLRHAAQLIGERSFRDIVLGRYRRPRAEERFFLFIDIVGSTPVAERLGALSVHRYLNLVFETASPSIDEQRGEVYQYVGDEIVVTWTMGEGRPEARPLACLFGIVAALAQAAPEFERVFGAVPKLRAALHAGEVVTGEVGGSRRAIVFHGDVMNATSRIENLTRTLGHPFLVSEDALARLEGAEAYALTDLGPQLLRGKDAPLRVYAVAAKHAAQG
jgi:adenylate cyclase